MISEQQFKEFKSAFLAEVNNEYPNVPRTTIISIWDVAMKNLLMTYAETEVDRKLSNVKGDPDA
jgi:hypothetical protein